MRANFAALRPGLDLGSVMRGAKFIKLESRVSASSQTFQIYSNLYESAFEQGWKGYFLSNKHQMSLALSLIPWLASFNSLSQLRTGSSCRWMALPQHAEGGRRRTINELG